MCYIVGESIGDAYLKALDAIVNRKMSHWYLIIHISRPILDTSTSKSISSLDINEWRSVINVGEVYDTFTKFKFSKPDGWTNGYSGMDWINGRIKDLLDDQGYYKKSLSRGFSFDQLQAVETRLSARSKKGNKVHGGSTNALCCIVFMPDEDLRAACEYPRPRASGLRCLTQIDLKPIGNELNLMAVFRSQYFDTKAYGNFIALAILLYKMCQKTGYKPGAIVSTANNVTFDRHKDSLYKHLKQAGMM